jgi:hypothetical protein
MLIFYQNVQIRVPDRFPINFNNLIRQIGSKFDSEIIRRVSGHKTTKTQKQSRQLNQVGLSRAPRTTKMHPYQRARAHSGKWPWGVWPLRPVAHRARGPTVICSVTNCTSHRIDKHNTKPGKEHTHTHTTQKTVAHA